MTVKSLDLTRITLAVLSIVGLIVVSFLVLRPFLAATVWAAMLVIATWPLMRRLQSAFGGRRWAAVTSMTLLLLVVVLLPLSLAVSSIVSHAGRFLEASDALSVARVPAPPAWLSDVPVLGRPVAEKWKSLKESSADDVVQLVRPYARTAMQWFIAAAGSLGGMVLHLLLTIGMAAILYAKGEIAADWCRLFGRRLADARGEEVVVLAGGAIRGVAFGVVLTALAQTFVTAIALWAAGVPQAGLLTAIALVLCVAQIGPVLVILPSIIWLFATGQTVAGIILVAIGVPALLMDNVLRPVLIKRGADLPLLLILLGVIGGLLAFGVLGLFLGPVILAVTYTLLQHWVDEAREDSRDTAASMVASERTAPVGTPAGTAIAQPLSR